MAKDLRERLKANEGLRLTSYRDSLGHWTIGYGRNLEVGISEAEAEFLLDNDIARVEQEVIQALPWVTQLPPLRLAVIQELAFILGTAGLLKFKIMLRCAAAGQFKEAARQINTSLFAQQVPGRAARLASMMLNNTEPPGA